MKRMFFVLTLVSLFALSLQAQNTTGTWTLYPAQAQMPKVSIRQPVNKDGTSVWNWKSVVPIQYDFGYGYGPVVFQSIFSNNPTVTSDDYSYLSFAPSGAYLFSQLTNLTAVYAFGTGNCQGGSLRWEIGLSNGKHIFIYYGAEPNTTDCTSDGPSTNQSGLNMVGWNDLRYDTSQLANGNFYDNYANAVSLAGSETVTYAALVLDSGWVSDQVVTLGNVTVNDNTFVPKSGFTTACPTDPATIEVKKADTSGGFTIDETPLSVTPDASQNFRILDCKYMYNLSGKSLGTGTYQVNLFVGATKADQDGVGTKFALR